MKVVWTVAKLAAGSKESSEDKISNPKSEISNWTYAKPFSLIIPPRCGV